MSSNSGARLPTHESEIMLIFISSLLALSSESCPTYDQRKLCSLGRSTDRRPETLSVNGFDFRSSTRLSSFRFCIERPFQPDRDLASPFLRRVLINGRAQFSIDHPSFSSQAKNSRHGLCHRASSASCQAPLRCRLKEASFQVRQSAAGPFPFGSDSSFCIEPKTHPNLALLRRHY